MHWTRIFVVCPRNTTGLIVKLDMWCLLVFLVGVSTQRLTGIIRTRILEPRTLAARIILGPGTQGVAASFFLRTNAFSSVKTSSTKLSD